MSANLPTLAALLKAGPLALLAAGVWWEVHLMRESVSELNACIAVLIDRQERDGSK